MNENKYDDREPYEPISEDVADNDLLEEYEEQLVRQKQAQYGGQEGNNEQPDELPVQMSPQAPSQPDEPKPPIYKQWWFWLIIAVVVVGIIVGLVVGLAKGDEKKSESSTSSVSVSTNNESTSGTSGASTTGQSATKSASTTKNNTSATKENETKYDEDSSYNLAFEEARGLSNLQHMSRQEIYNELTSPNGGRFTAEAAEYALEKLNADYAANAIVVAQEYYAQGINEEKIYKILVEEHLFTDGEAQTAVDRL